MSLQAFHKFFISVAILFCGWLAGSELRSYSASGAKESLYVGVAVGTAALALIVYFIWFLRKSKKWPSP